MHAYNGTLVELSDIFKTELVDAYQKQKWSMIWTELDQARKAHKSAFTPGHTATVASTAKAITSNSEKSERRYGTEFQMHEWLIYHVDLATGRRQLCISKVVMKKMFEMAHNQAFYMGYHQTFNAIAEGLYVKQLAHHLKQYIACCPQCRVN